MRCHLKYTTALLSLCLSWVTTTDMAGEVSAPIMGGVVACNSLAQPGAMGFDSSDGVEVATRIDAYIDARCEGTSAATTKLLSDLAAAGITTMPQLESALRARRAKYPDTKVLIGKFSIHKVRCYHVDYESEFMLFVPPGYRADKRSPLVVVGHGGNSSMSPERAASVAKLYLSMYAPPVGKQMNALVVAPVSTRGWGHIGNSLILSTISKLKRIMSIDPDRIYVTGQSMGGHMAYRAALTLSDRWGAVSPHSGGYDFVKKKSIGNLLNVPGYAVWGMREPYGIDQDNRTNAAWGKKHGLEWKYVEKDGGHTIYQDELPKMAKFFMDHPRDLYRKTVYLRQGGAMKFLKTWQVKGWPEHNVYSDRRPLRWNIQHWIEVEPRPDLKEPLTVLAKNRGKNEFAITTRNVRRLFVYLAPKMVDFAKPVTIIVNGETLYQGVVEPDPQRMFELVREFDDRGRIFWARIPLDVKTDADVVVPVTE